MRSNQSASKQCPSAPPYHRFFYIEESANCHIRKLTNAVTLDTNHHVKKLFTKPLTHFSQKHWHLTVTLPLSIFRHEPPQPHPAITLYKWLWEIHPPIKITGF